MNGSTLVLGLGNVLLHDDGIGVWVVNELERKFEFPTGVAVLEGGTLGLDLLPRLDGVERLLLIDAVTIGRAAGALVRFEGEEVPGALDLKLSPHQIGLRDLLGTAQLTGREPPHVVLWGMQPEQLDAGTGFSPRVAAALPGLARRVLDELLAWGVMARPRQRAVSLPLWWEAPRVRSAR